MSELILKVGRNSLDFLLWFEILEKFVGSIVGFVQGAHQPNSWFDLCKASLALCKAILVCKFRNMILIAQHHSLNMFIQALKDFGYLYGYALRLMFKTRRRDFDLKKLRMSLMEYSIFKTFICSHDQL